MVILKTTVFLVGLFGVNSVSVSETVVPSLEQCSNYLVVQTKEYSGEFEWSGMHSLQKINRGNAFKTLTTLSECINIPE